VSSLKAQTDLQMSKTRQAKPEFMQSLDDVITSARKFQQGAKAISIGEHAPDFLLPSAQGYDVSLADLLVKGPVVLTFYRGDWCPYCNLQLKAMHGRLAEIHALGAELVAVSPQAPNDSLTKTEREELAFLVLSDDDARVAAQYGVAWEVPELILEHMRKDRNLELADLNNGNGSVLPIPATFVIGVDGAVKWRYVDVDYRQRAEPEDIVNALKNLQKR
jgi:peroxiredoxin